LRYLSSLVVAFAILAAASGVEAQSAAATPKSAGNVDNGKHVFTSAGCFACHGAQGQGTAAAPPLAPPQLELPALIAYVRRPAATMPAVPASVASDEDLADVYAFLKSVAPAPAASESLTGNAENGKKLFAAYGCYQCHGHQGAGASTGPRVGPPQISMSAFSWYVRAPRGQMPPYTAKVVSDQDLADIYAYLKTFQPPVPASGIPLLNQ
jgi:mono/diheme cytochrome c family protein